jgi:predicted nucleic-acid-binding Zn-ribbon protein
MRNNLCPKCSSSEIIPGVEVRDYDAGSYRELTIHVRLPRPAGALIHKGSETSNLRARVCGQCGYTELYAPNFAALLNAHKKAQGQ